jgi:hypothetical protein
MPKRSNDFQRLILLIERQLAPNGARVVESRLISDSRENVEREIDVAIEIPAGGRTLLVAVECIEHGRKADIQWIDKLIGKYRDLPVAGIIAVSKSGFTESARRKAELHHINAISFADAEKIDWQMSIGTPVRLEYHHIQVRPWKVSYRVETSFDFSDWPAQVINNARVVTRDGEDLGSVLDIRRQIQESPEPRAEAVAALDSPGTIRAILRGEMPPGARMRFADGRECQLLWIDMELTYLREDVSLPLEHIRYGEAHVAHAQGKRDGHQIQIAVVRMSDGTVRGSASVQADPGRTVTILDRGKEVARLDARSS